MPAAGLRRGEQSLLPAALALVLLTAGCGEYRAALRLVDGSATPMLPAMLAGVDGRLAPGRVRVVRVLPHRHVERRIRVCLGGFRAELQHARVGPIVERVGLLGRSLTFRAGPLLLGCDASAGPHDRDGPWCAESLGVFRQGRLVDPRLTVLCEDAVERPVGFGWLEPVRGARWVAIGDRDHAELYATAGGVPVRVTTTQVGVESADFHATQYAADGTELDRRTITMRVAG